MHMMDFTKIFIKLYGFFFMEIYSLLFKNMNEQDKQIELKLLPQDCKINHISEMRVWIENCNLAEKENVNSISTKLYNRLKALEKQNISEQVSNIKTVAHGLELKKHTEHITFERNEFEHIGHELCVGLKKKIAEMESKYMLEKTLKQEEMIKVLELEKQIESITLEKNKLEFIVADLHTELFTSYEDKLDKLTVKNIEDTLTAQCTMYKEFQQSINKYEKNFQKLHNNLNKCISETSKLTQKLVFLQNIEEKFNKMVVEKGHVFHQQKILIDHNEKLNKELTDIRKYMINELTSLKCNENSIDFSNKSVNEIFAVLMQVLLSKEKEVIMMMQEEHERATQGIENEKQQWVNVANCATTMVKELKAEIERFQTEKEGIHAGYKEQIHQLKHILRKSINERKIFKKELYKGIRNGFHSLIN